MADTVKVTIDRGSVAMGDDVGRYYAKTLGEDEYQSAVARLHAELSDLGELPGPV